MFNPVASDGVQLTIAEDTDGAAITAHILCRLAYAQSAAPPRESLTAKPAQKSDVGGHRVSWPVTSEVAVARPGATRPNGRRTHVRRAVAFGLERTCW